MLLVKSSVFLYQRKLQDGLEPWTRAWITIAVFDFAYHPPECVIISFNCISRISITLIAMGKQYSRTVCCNLVMRRDLFSRKMLLPCPLCKCFVHPCSGKLSDNNQGWTWWPLEVLPFQNSVNQTHVLSEAFSLPEVDILFCMIFLNEEIPAWDFSTLFKLFRVNLN